jgi:HemY protein
MRTLLTFFFIAVLIAIGAAWLASNPGQVTVDWIDWRIETSVSAVVGLLFAALLAVIFSQRLLYWLLRESPLSAPRRRESRRRRGMQALSKGVVALALGEPGEAELQTKKATKLIGADPMVLLLAAQAAQLSGHREAANEHFRSMMNVEETAFLGVRGLLIWAIEEGDPEQAMTLSDRAFELQPKGRWVLETRLDLLSRLGRWSEARDTLRLLQKYKHVTADMGERHRAVLHYCEALENDLAGKGDEALRLTTEAHKLAPGLAPAAVLASRLLVGNDNSAKAGKILEESWHAAPHPTLAEAYINLSLDETATERFRRVGKLTATNPDHMESRLTIAEQAIAVQHWGEAREQLQAALEQNPPVRAYRLLAEIERREVRDEKAARKWDNLAVKASADPEWVCKNCGAERHLWAPRCTSCLSFDSFVWETPGKHEPLRPIGTPQLLGLPTLSKTPGA